MFTIKLVTKHRDNTNAVFVCPKCFTLISKAFWWDTPIRTIHDRCWTCQSRIPDHESLIRDVEARKDYHFGTELPVNKSGILYY